jgi:hypothetical protein
MSPEAKPEGKPKERPLRMSRPPPTVFLWDGAGPAFSIPGGRLKSLERGLAPPANEVRSMLLKLRKELLRPRPAMAAILGIRRPVSIYEPLFVY